MIDMIDINSEKLIAYCVNKVTKGVRKQIKGYVKNIQNDISSSIKRIEYLVADFNGLLERTKYIRKDFEAVDMMLKESCDHKKMLLEMKILHNELRNKFIDFELLIIEMKQQNKIREMKHE